jgi:nucleoside-diphosphate-sugar epimerase
MNVLLTGANGFIGRYLIAALIGAGHHVVPAVRRPSDTDLLLPAAASIAVDFNHDTRPDDWIPRLAGIDAVINCAGILQARGWQSITSIHATAPIALFTACRRAGVRRVIQISAISADAAGTALGVALISRWRPVAVAIAQATVIAAYTAGLTYAAPSLWTDPFGPLLKNVPVLVAALVLAAIETDR